MVYYFLSVGFKADYHRNKSFNLRFRAESDACRLRQEENRGRHAAFEAVLFALRRRLDTTEASKRFTDMDFLQIRVINFSGRLMRKRRDASQIAPALMFRAVMLLFDI